MHDLFAIFQHIEWFFWRCLINETALWCYMSKEFATATLRESLASRLQMSGGQSNGSWSSATPVTVLGEEPPAHQKTGPTKLECLMWKIASETVISSESVSLIAKQELQLKPYELQRVQLPTADNMRVRLERCQRLLHRVAPLNWERILFTDKKRFTIEQAHNHQNDRGWCAEATGTSVIVEHCQNKKSVMVSAGIWATGKTPLAFVDWEVKINQNVYRRDSHEAVGVPWARSHFGPQQWTLQQDSASAHRAKATQEWCEAHFPDFTSGEWRPYSPDLNNMITEFGQFWRQGPVLSPTKTRRFGSSRCGGGRADCRRKSCGSV